MGVIKMLKSVWLSNLITSSMSAAGTVLLSHYRNLSELVHAEKSVMALSEPDDGRKSWFLTIKMNTCLTPGPGMNVSENIMQGVMKSKTAKREGALLYCPLYFENIASFGCIVFETACDGADEETFRAALIAFSSVLYTEAMGSIVKSFHDTAMRVENVCVDYGHGKIVERAVDNASLEIYDKEFTVIAGSSGCGKSTLLNVMGGMLTPTEGTARWKDKSITQMSEKEKDAYRAGTVGFIFQRYNLLDDLTAEENIEIAASLVKHPFSAKEVLEMVGLEKKAKSYPSQLSGGEQQRVCIARALVKRAGILLCDEPTGALDTANAKQIISILQNIAKGQGIPVVMITHNPGYIVLADHCITMSNGRIADDRLQPFALSAEELKLS